jgi:hypothetical protein
MSEVTVVMKFQIQSCIKCGVAFGITAEHDAELRRSGRTFYCPNGHDMCYSVKPDETKKLLEAERQRTERLATELAETQKKLYNCEHRGSGKPRRKKVKT